MKRVPMLLFTAIAAIVGVALASILDNYLFRYIGYNPLRVGIFFTIPALFCTIAAIISIAAAPMVSFSKDGVFSKCCVFALLIATVGTFLLSAGAQILYERTPVSVDIDPKGQSIVVLLDISDSMEYLNCFESGKEATKKLVGALNENDEVGLIFFDYGMDVQSKLQTADSSTVKMLQRRLDDQPIGGGTNIIPPIEEAISMLEKAEMEDRAIFIITDAEEIDTDLNAGDYSNEFKKSFDNNGISLHCLSLKYESNELKKLCKSSGGSYKVTEDPDDIEDVYMQMFDDYHVVEQSSVTPLIHHPGRHNAPMSDSYYTMISMVFYTLLGLLMAAVYSILYNHKRMIFFWNFIMGIAAAGIMEFINYACYEYPGPLMLMLMLFAIFIIFPALFIGTIPSDDFSKNGPTYIPDDVQLNDWMYDQDNVLE